ncbi:MAG: class I tRNA ligase family protein, partial [Bullifex sp.]
DMDSFKMGSRFANKIWNATRFLLMNLEGRNLVEITPDKLTLMDKWIYHQMKSAIDTINKAMGGYRFNEAAQAVYSFFWNDFCDWYIEAGKMRLLHGSDEEKDLASSIMMDVLEKSMRMMHPFLSFVTEEIYQKLPNNKGMLISQDYPVIDDAFDFASEAALVSEIQEAVRIVRAVRSKLSIAPEKKLHVVIRTGEDFDAKDVFESEKAMMASFMGAGTLEIDSDGSVDTSKAFPSSALGFEVFTFVREAIDVDAEIKKLENEIAKAEKNLEGSNRKLSNEQFVKNAKPEAIAKEKAKKAEFEEVIAKAVEHIALLRTL